MIHMLEQWTGDLPGMLEAAVVASVAAALGAAVAFTVHLLLFRVLRRIAKASLSPTDDIVIERLARPTRYAMIALGLVLAARETPVLGHVWERIAGFVMPALIGWIALSLSQALVKALEARPDITTGDNHHARRRLTRLAILSRIASFIIVFLTVGLMLLSIPGVRDIGVTLMASAGLAGLAVGAAAQPALKSLIAGFQMALTEPVSIGDTVTIDGQSGRVTEIRTTYVMLATDDGCTLIVPTSKFLEMSFRRTG